MNVSRSEHCPTKSGEKYCDSLQGVRHPHARPFLGVLILRWQRFDGRSLLDRSNTFVDLVYESPSQNID